MRQEGFKLRWPAIAVGRQGSSLIPDGSCIKRLLSAQGMCGREMQAHHEPRDKEPLADYPWERCIGFSHGTAKPSEAVRGRAN